MEGEKKKERERLWLITHALVFSVVRGIMSKAGVNPQASRRGDLHWSPKPGTDEANGRRKTMGKVVRSLAGKKKKTVARGRRPKVGQKEISPKRPERRQTRRKRIRKGEVQFAPRVAARRRRRRPPLGRGDAEGGDRKLGWPSETEGTECSG